MGRNVFTAYDYSREVKSRGIDTSRPTRVTAKAEQKVRETGKLDPAVDPGVDPIRRSLLRFDPTEDKRWCVTVGCPMDIELSLDTTGSMGDNVDIAMRLLPETYALVAEMLKGYDPQLALGIFGDVVDKFVLCRPQFEMTADKIVDYLTKMHPEGNGGDYEEDPQYAAFAAAYLTSTYTNRIGLKGYHFIVTDADCHNSINAETLERIFGKGVWEALADNGHPEITRQNLPDVQDVFLALAEQRHAFLIAVEREGSWHHFYRDRVIQVFDTNGLPAVEAALIGYTEGVLQPLDVEEYLTRHGVAYNIHSVAEDICKQEFAAQRKLEQVAGYKIPRAGDIFAKKTDVQPVPEDDGAKPSDAEIKKEPAAWL